MVESRGTPPGKWLSPSLWIHPVSGLQLLFSRYWHPVFSSHSYLPHPGPHPWMTRGLFPTLSSSPRPVACYCLQHSPDSRWGPLHGNCSPFPTELLLIPPLHSMCYPNWNLLSPKSGHHFPSLGLCFSLLHSLELRSSFSVYTSWLSHTNSQGDTCYKPSLHSFHMCLLEACSGLVSFSQSPVVFRLSLCSVLCHLFPSPSWTVSTLKTGLCIIQCVDCSR